jgi:hypothetical protein
MKQFGLIYRNIPAFVLILTITGCRPVTVSCVPQLPAIDNKVISNEGDFQMSKVGFINSTGASLGNVYELTKTSDNEVWANPDRSVTYDRSDKEQFLQGQPADQTVDLAMSWALDAGASSKVDSTQQAKIEAGATNSWKVVLSKASQVQLKSTLDQINNAKTGDSNYNLKSHIIGNPNSIFLVLNPALEGDSATTNVNNTATANLTYNVSIGFLIWAKVSYSCQSDVLRKSVGPEQTTLITYVELVKASDDKKSVVHATGADLKSTHYLQAQLSNPTHGKPKTRYTLIHLCKDSGNPAEAIGCKAH